jgi:tRNA (guanosine-2'-O-)-methyltransferase
MSETALLPKRIRRAEARDPGRVIRALEPLVTDRRRDRLREVFRERLASVTVLFDSPYDPHNGAAVIRSCDAFGVQALHVVEREHPFLVSDTVTRGAEKWVDVLTYKRVADAVERVEGEGYTLVTAEANGELLPTDLAQIPRLCLVLGAEHDGVSAELQRAAKLRVRVPMRGFVESLNVSVTAAILLSYAVAGRPGDLAPHDLERLYARGLYLTVPRAEDVLGPELDDG